MASISEAERGRLHAKYPEVFHRTFWQRWGLLLAAVLTSVYLAFCFVFFNVGPAFVEGRWDRAGVYIQDWYSWRAQPNLKIEDGAVVANWSSRKQYPDDVPIDWLAENADGSVSVLFAGAENRVDVRPSQVTAYVDGTAFEMALGGESVMAPSTVPDQIVQDGDKVVVDYGFAGQAEIRTGQVRVQRRFLGWSNFFFDTDSVLWGKNLVDIAGLVLNSERLVPALSNAELIGNELINNSIWQHGDILSKLMQTLVMAFVGTLLGTVVAFPLAFIAARNITGSRAANWGMKRLFDFLRSIDMLIWALFFTRSFGPGPIPGIAAIFFTDTGALGKVYAEALENVDDKQREGVQSVGASPAAVNRYGVIPQVLPVFISQSLYFWESNTRSATIIGAVGAGGIGLKLLEAMKTNADWDKVAYMVVLILAVVFAFDNVSNAIRSRLIGPRQH